MPKCDYPDVTFVRPDMFSGGTCQNSLMSLRAPVRAPGLDPGNRAPGNRSPGNRLHGRSLTESPWEMIQRSDDSESTGERESVMGRNERHFAMI